MVLERYDKEGLGNYLAQAVFDEPLPEALSKLLLRIKTGLDDGSCRRMVLEVLQEKQVSMDEFYEIVKGCVWEPAAFLEDLYQNARQ